MPPSATLVCDEMVRLGAGIIGSPYEAQYSFDTVEDTFNNWMYSMMYRTTHDITEADFLNCFGLKRSPGGNYDVINDFLDHQHKFPRSVRRELRNLQDLLDG